jgi:hypothetical protein
MGECSVHRGAFIPWRWWFAPYGFSGAIRVTDPLDDALNRAEAILKPKSFRIAQRRNDLGGIRVESSAVDYWDAVHALEDSLSGPDLDDALRDLGAARLEIVELERQLEQAELRENVLRQALSAVHTVSRDAL